MPEQNTTIEATASETPSIETPVAVVVADPSTVAPDNVDALTQATARLSRQAWQTLQAYKHDMTLIFLKRLDVHIEARTDEGAHELANAMRAVSIPAVTVKKSTVQSITTFAKLQQVIKHPAILHLDAVPLD
jgi:hypothetical protein